ncbi:MAG TPA: PKD domain-containing protein [Bacteroidia bacterium]|nr:PKD domain-containing protein [Bacteroidia bacterium]
MKSILLKHTQKFYFKFSLLIILCSGSFSASAQDCDIWTAFSNGQYIIISPPTCSWLTQGDALAPANCKWYAVYAEAGYQYSFKTGCGDGGNANFDTYFELYDNYGTLLMSNDDGCSSPFLSSSLTYTAPITDYIILKVTGFSGAGGDFTLAYQRTVGNLFANFTNSINGSTVDFTDASSGPISTYSWDFGDGNSSSSQNPSNTYLCPGHYNVSLTVTDINGCSNEFISAVDIVGAQVTAGYTSAVTGNQVSFTNSSTGTISSYYWDFGDGTNSTAQSPVQTYTCSGFYYVTLTVYDNNGCGNTTGNYIYASGDPTAEFAISSVSGTTVSFEDNSQGTNLTWLWDFGDGTTDTQQNPTHTYACPGGYTITLTVGSLGPCTSRPAYRYVNIIGNPTASFFHTVNGTTATFTNTSTGTITGYQWSFGDGGTSTAPNPTRTYACPGDYFVSLIATTAAGCTSNTGVVVHVEGDPHADFTFSPAGTTVSFTNNSTGTNPTYFWNFGDGNTSTQANPSNTYLCGGTYNVYLTVTNQTGCVVTLNQAVEVVGDPNPGFIATVLPGLTVDFSNTSTGIIQTYYWDFGDGQNSNQATPTHIYACPGIYTVSLTVSGSNGCVVQKNQEVTLTGLPTSSFTFITSGADVTFTNTSAGSGLTYAWSFGDGSNSSQENPTHTYACGGHKTVYLTVTGPTGCSNYSYQTVEIVTDPFASYTAISNGTTVDFTSTSIGNITDYFWSFDNGSYSVASTASQTYNTCGEHSVYFYVTSGSGCTDYLYSTITVPFIGVSASDTILTAEANGASYQWVDCNNGFALIPNETNQSYHASVNGNYAVIVTAGSCTDTSECYTVTTVGIDPSFAEPKISIYPNPSNNRFNVLSEGSGQVTITVTDLIGQTIYSKQITANGSFTQVLDLTNESAGVYTLKLQPANGRAVTRKLVKE